MGTPTPASPTAETSERSANIDEPLAGAVMSRDRFTLRGWMDTAGLEEPAVIVRANGVAVATGPVVGARPDVAGILGRTGDDLYGFELLIDLDPWLGDAAASVTLRIDAIDGSSTTAAVNIEVPRRVATAVAMGAPSQGARLRIDEVGIFGWGVVRGRAGRFARVVVDGTVVATAAIDQERPDVAEYLGDDSLLVCGFELQLDLTQIAGVTPGIAQLWVEVVTDDPNDGRAVSEQVTVELYKAPPDLRGFLESPEVGELLEPTLVRVFGWAYCAQPAVDAVEIRVDGELAGRARLGIQRFDLDEVFADDAAVIAGFELPLDLGDLDPAIRRIHLEVIARYEDGSTEKIASRFHPLAPPKRQKLSASEQSRRDARVEVLRDRNSALLKLVEPSDSGALHLLAVTHDLGYGGGQLWLSELLDRSGAGRSYACTVVSPTSGPLRKDLERLGIEVHVTGAVPVTDYEAYEGFVAELTLWSKAVGVNAVLSNTMLAFPGPDLADRLHLPCAWAIHESWSPRNYLDVVFPPDYLDPDVRERIVWALGRADLVIFEAAATRELYLSHVAPERAVVIPYGVRVSEIERYRQRESREEFRRRRGFGPKDVLLLVIGTIEPRKAQTMIADAFARVAASHPEARLVFVGDMRTDYSKALRRFVLARGLASRVSILPIDPDVFSWYNAADVFLCASDIESLPRSVLEAMCFDVPIIATSVFGLSEVLTDGKTGLLIEPRDTGALATALDQFLASEETTRVGIGTAGGDFARGAFDSSGYAQAIVDWFSARFRGSPPEDGTTPAVHRN